MTAPTMRRKNRLRKSKARGLGTEVPTGGEGPLVATVIGGTRWTDFEGASQRQMVHQVVASFEEDEVG